MNAAEHYQTAERLLALADGVESAEQLKVLAAAQVHAVLAVAAQTASTVTLSIGATADVPSVRDAVRHATRTLGAL